MKGLTTLLLAHLCVTIGFGAFSHAFASTEPLPLTLATAAAPLSSMPVQQTLADQPANISLHIDNGDIYNVIKIIADELKLNYVIDPSVKGTVNITTNTSVRRSDLLGILETILKLNGATMVPNGNFKLIVPANTASRQLIPVQQGALRQDADDQMILYIQRMKHVTASEMSKILTPYLTEGANIKPLESGDTLLITERKSNLPKLLEIIQIFD